MAGLTEWLRLDEQDRSNEIVYIHEASDSKAYHLAGSKSAAGTGVVGAGLLFRSVSLP